MSTMGSKRASCGTAHLVFGVSNWSFADAVAALDAPMRTIGCRGGRDIDQSGGHASLAGEHQSAGMVA